MIREVILLSMGLIVLAEWEVISDNQEKRGAQIYCGEVLAKTLHFICGGSYNSPFKKSYEYPVFADYDTNGLANEEKIKYRFPFSTKSKALSVLEYRRIKRGVHDECCRKSCSLNELRSYCAKGI